jgi:hypothetical protein
VHFTITINCILMNFKFDLLEIKTAIEEKRLILALKFEKFLHKKFKNFLCLLQNFFSHENCSLYLSFFIALVSFFIRSKVDIGYYSAYNIDFADKLGKSLNFKDQYFGFIFLLIPLIKLANFLAINKIIFIDYFFNFLGLLSIFFSHKILKNSQIFSKKITLNLVIISFATSYFWRLETLIYNDFIIEQSFLLILIFLFLSYQIINIEKLDKRNQIRLAIISNLIIALNFKYIIIIISFEIIRFLKIKNFKNFFNFYNVFFVIFFVNYLYLLTLYFPSYFVSLNSQTINQIFIKLFSADILNNFIIYFYFLVIFFFVIKENKYLNNLAILMFSALLLLATDPLDSITKSLFYSLSFPLVFLTIFNLKSLNNLFFKKNWFIIVSILILCFSGAEFDEILNFYLSQKITIIIICFIILYADYSKIFQKISQKIMIFLVFFTFFNHSGKIFRSLFSIRDLNNRYALDYLVNPSSRTDFLYNISQKNLLSQQKIIFLNNKLSDIYPYKNYHNKFSDSEFKYYDIIQINSSKNDLVYYKKTLNNLISQINDNNNLMFLSYNSSNCFVNLLEIYLRNPEFKKIFINNFKYENSFLKNIKVSKTNFEQIQGDLTDQEFEIISQINNENEYFNTNEYEVYVRR